MTNNNKAFEVSLNLVYADPAKNTRKNPPSKVEERALSIVDEGQLQPVEVQELAADHPQRANGFEYELVFGFTRHAAIGYINEHGLYDGDVYPDGMPIWVRLSLPKDDKGRFLTNVSENAQRDDLTPIDKAIIIKTAKEVHGMTQKEIGKRLGLKESTASSMLKLLDAPAKIQKRIIDGKVSWAAVVEALALDGEEKKNALEALSKDAASGAPTGRGAVRAAARGDEEAETESEETPDAKKRKVARTLKEVRVYFAERAEPEEGDNDKKNLRGAEICKAVLGYIDGKFGYKKLDSIIYGG